MAIHRYQSIYRFVFRRPRVPAGAVGFTYSAPILSILIVLTVVSAVELVVVDVIVHRWAPGLRVPLLVLGGWGLVWLIGLLLGVLTRPHAVGPDGVRVRFADDPRSGGRPTDRSVRRRSQGLPGRGAPPHRLKPESVQLKAATPVRAWPITSWWTSEVPS
jgi:hypothetical protein